MYKKFVIEPRFPDGSLDVKSKHWSDNRLTSFWNKASENQLFDYFFHLNPTHESVGLEELHKWYNQQGLYIREKNW